MLRAVSGGWLRHGGKGKQGSSSSPASAPTSSLAAGKYDRAMTQAIVLSTTSGGASIYYTVDGSNPTTGSTLYTGAIPVDTTTTIKAIASGGGFTDSTVFSATYTILSPQLYVPCNGFNTGTSFADCSGYAKTITRNGDTQTSTTRNKYGGSSGRWDGTDDYLSTTITAPGTGDFIFAADVYCDGTANRGWFHLGATVLPGNVTNSVALGYDGAGNLNFYANNTFQTAAITLTTGAFFKILVTRLSGRSKVFIDGVKFFDIADTFNYTGTALCIGGYFSTSYLHLGNMNNFAAFHGNGLTDAEALAWYNANVAFAPHPDLLLHMDGTNGSTTFTDSSNSALTVTANGNAQLSTSNPKFGTAAGSFDGTGDYLSLGGQAAFAYGSCDFTIEGWLDADTPNPGADMVMYDSRPASTNGAYPLIFVSSTNGYLGYFVSSSTRIIGSTNVGSSYIHVAVCRKAGTTTLYLAGQSQGTWSDTTTYLNGSSRPLMGADGAVPTVGGFDGLMDEWQSIKGFAKYDGNFTPPTRAFVA